MCPFYLLCRESLPVDKYIFFGLARKHLRSFEYWCGEEPKSPGACRHAFGSFDDTLVFVNRWDFKSTTEGRLTISTTDCTYAFCTSGTFYIEIKGKKKKKLKLSGLVIWPDGKATSGS